MADDLKDAEAKAIAEFLLEETGVAIRTKNFDAFAPHFRLPITAGSFDGDHLAETMEDLRRIFDGVVGCQKSRSVTDMVREVIASSFIDEDTIGSTHMTYLLSGTQMVIAPYACHSILRRVDGEWSVAESRYAVDTHTKLSAVLAGRFNEQKDDPNV